MCLLVVNRCVNKNDEKGTFFKLDSVQRCHHLGWENAIFVEKGYAFYKFTKTLWLGG